MTVSKYQNKDCKVYISIGIKIKKKDVFLVVRKNLAYAVLGLALLIIYGSLAISLFTDSSQIPVSPSILLTALILNTIIMVGSSFLFVYLMYGKNLLEKLYYKKERLVEAVAIGIAACFLFLVIQMVVSAILLLLGYKEENPLVEEIAKEINLLLLFLLPLLAAISEETFFRGLIQMHLEKKIGAISSILLTSLLFAIAHLEYKTLLQFLFPFLFSILLGFLMYKWRNIFAPISAHFLYNFISLYIVSHLSIVL